MQELVLVCFDQMFKMQPKRRPNHSTASLSPGEATVTPGESPHSIRRSIPSKASDWLMDQSLHPAATDPHGVSRNHGQCHCPPLQFPLPSIERELAISLKLLYQWSSSICHATSVWVPPPLHSLCPTYNWYASLVKGRATNTTKMPLPQDHPKGNYQEHPLSLNHLPRSREENLHQMREKHA
nr:uncharacterized protein LOC110083200 isoform X2 [Pogona vitticeps]